MPAYARRARRTVDIWPGWVDALSTLLIIVMFVLLVLVLGQVFLSAALSGRDKQLGQLSGQMADLANQLALEKQAHAEVEANLGKLTAEFVDTKANLDALSLLQLETSTKLAEKSAEADARAAENVKLSQNLAATTEANTIS